MKTSMRNVSALGLCLLCAAPFQAATQNAPGEDPVILVKRIGINMLPMPAPSGSKPINLATGLPASTQAKIARYEAKSNSDQTSGMLTDADVSQASASDGFKKTCIQEVGSNVQPASPGGMRIGANNQQIVVLRGDLVNICK